MNRSAPAFLYALHCPYRNAVKIGITASGTKEDRLRGFQRTGWLILTRTLLPTWSEAMAIEQAVLRHFRKDLHLSHYLTAEQMEGMGGHTETFDADVVSPQTLIAAIRSQRGRIEKNAPKEAQ